jgi:CubicO group peptidase (beta-lactamase class C family)
LPLCGVLAIAICACNQAMAPARNIQEFEGRMRDLQAEARIPGLTVGISHTGDVPWIKGFGTMNVASGDTTTDSTSYHLASLTKTFASTILLQLVEEQKLSLDDPVTNYGIQLPEGSAVRVRHLLSHTSQGTPGSTYIYNGDRFGLLDSVIRRVDGRTFGQAVYARIVTPLNLRWTAPMATNAAFGAFNRDSTSFAANLARGYTIVNRAPQLTSYPTYFGAAAGLTSNVPDILAYSAALDNDQLISASSRELAFAGTATSSGTSPYGLGWFSTEYRGIRVVWHYGLWTAISSLIVKVPDRGFTFVVLANSDALTSRYPLAAGRLDTSPWAREFLDAFVLGTAQVP